MPNTQDVIYYYDGSFEGLLCCVFESYVAHEMPVDIVPEDEAQPSLFVCKSIETNEAQAMRVYHSITQKISKEATDLVQCVFFSCTEQKEWLILRFLRYGYKHGACVMRQVSHPIVHPLLAAERHLRQEAHLFTGFVRFADYDGVLIATIAPKNFVLPYIRAHFCTRFAIETFLIYDKTHKAALIWRDRKAELVSIDALTLPEESETEQATQALWKQFYNTIAITARENPRCRMTHCPKRYWGEMTELRDA